MTPALSFRDVENRPAGSTGLVLPRLAALRIDDAPGRTDLPTQAIAPPRLLQEPPPDEAATVEVRAERAEPGGGPTGLVAEAGERPLTPSPPRRTFDTALCVVLAVSAATHALVLAAVFWLAPLQPKEAPPVSETPIEVVVEKPPEPPRAAAEKAAQEKAAAAAQEQEKAAREKAAEASVEEAKATERKAAEAKAERETVAREAEAAAQDKRAQEKAEQDAAARDKAAREQAREEERKAAAAQARAAETAKQEAAKQAAQKQQAARSREAKAAAAAQERGARQAAASKAATDRVATAKPGAAPGSRFASQTAPLPFDNGPQIFRAVAVPLPTPGGDELMSYKMIVFGMLERAKQYPPGARERGARGSAVVSFEIDDAGGLTNVSLVRSSGDSDLDVESLALVARASPFPKPPPDAQHAFAAEITFDLQPPAP